MKNVGAIDKVLRIVIGILLAGVGIFSPVQGGLRIGIWVVAIVALLTGFTGF